MESRLETVTPKKAAEWLGRNTRNRPLDVHYAERIAEAILRGEWKVNGDTIKMNGDILIDGQHRLHAICKSGVAVQSYVVRGVQSDAFNTLDQNKRRTVGHMLAREGEKKYNALANACKFLWHYEAGTVRSMHNRGSFTPTLAWTVLKSHVGLRDSLELVSSVRVQSLMSLGTSAALHWLMTSKDEALAEVFWTGLCTGENITKAMPVYLVRERFLKNRTDQSKLRQNVLAAFVVKAWNATRKGIKLGVVKWLDDEEFPGVQ